MEGLERAAYNLLRSNRMITTNGLQYTMPSPDMYPFQWLWDSCFHAIILSRIEPEAAKRELESLVSAQFEDGMLPHVIYWKPGGLHQYNWGADGKSSLTQPPIIAYAAWEIYRHTNDTAFLGKIYPHLRAFYHYLIEKRDPRDHHLLSIINPDESGEDNSPRFDSVLKVPVDIGINDHLNRRLELLAEYRNCNLEIEQCMRNHFWVKDVPFNSIMIRNLDIMAHIASLLNKTDDEHFYKLHADLITKAMRELMYEGGVFWSTQGAQYEKLKVTTWAHFAPLFANVYTHEEAAVLVEHYLKDDETIRSPWGIRTVSKKEPSYRSDGFWRGPVWMAPHWFIWHGLTQYGFTKEAAWVRDKSSALLETSGFREYFDPETGKGYGAHNFTWGALVLDMIKS